MKSSIVSLLLFLLVHNATISLSVGELETNSGETLRADYKYGMRQAASRKLAIESDWVRVGSEVIRPESNLKIVDGWNTWGLGLIAMSGDSSVVSMGDVKGTSNNRGSVKVFANEGGSLTQLGNTFEGVSAGDNSAFVSLSSDGKILAIGSPRWDATKIGKVDVYEFSNDTWNRQNGNIDVGSISILQGFTHERLNLSGDGKTIAVGTGSKVMVYKFIGSTWIKVQEIIEQGVNTGPNALSEDGNKLVVGSRGFVGIYEFSAGTYTRVQGLKMGNMDPTTTGYGEELYMIGNFLVVSAHKVNNWTGNVFIYECVEVDNIKRFEQKGNTIIGLDHNEVYGTSPQISIDGDTLSFAASNIPNFEGRIEVFDFNAATDTWVKRDTTDNFVGKANSDSFGAHRLSADGTTIFAGSPYGGYVATYKLLENWKIYAPVVDMDASSSVLSIYHLLGDKPSDADVALYNRDCKSPVLEGDVISMPTKSYTKDNHKLMYTVAIDEILIGTSSLVSFDDENQFQQSKGTISFCTRVETYHQSSFAAQSEPFLAKFLNTNYIMNFDLTSNEFILTGVVMPIPSTAPSFVPSSNPNLSSHPSTNTKMPSSIPSRTNTKMPSSMPSRAPKPDPIVVVTVPYVLEIANVTLPEDPEERDSLIEVLEQTIADMLDAGESVDVIVTAINGIAINNNSTSTRIGDVFNIDNANVEFDVVEKILCVGSCDKAKESVANVTSNKTQALMESLSSGSFATALVANAVTKGVKALQSASVNVESFVSGEPEVLVITSSPTFAPSPVPTVLSSTKPSTNPSSIPLSSNSSTIDEEPDPSTCELWSFLTNVIAFFLILCSS